MRVVVVGAGITGAATALALAEAGAEVVVLERRRPAAMASGWTLAGVRQSGRDPAELMLAREAVAAWGTLDERLGASAGYRRTGNLRLARDEGEAAAIRAMVEEQRARGLDLDLLDGAALREVAPALGPRVRLASFCPTDGQAEPLAAVGAFRAAGERLGVSYRSGTTVLRLHAGAGFRGVETADGLVEADACVLAAGVETNALLAPLGLDVPMTVGLVAAMETEPLPPLLGPVIGTAGADLAIRQRACGRVRFTGGVEPAEIRVVERDGAPRVSPPAVAVRGALERAAAAVPALARAPVAEVWGGLIDAAPDGLPTLDRAPGVEGLVVAAGFSGHGFGIAPAVGPALADLALGRERPDLAAFRMGRTAAPAPPIAPAVPAAAGLHG